MQQVLDFLKRHQGKRTALVCHLRPDGDAIGSALALADTLSRNGTPAQVVGSRPLPSYLQFLLRDDGLVREYETDDWYRDYDCLGVLDCGETGRLTPRNRLAVDHLPTFTVDHHATSDGLGEARWIKPDASSTGEMVYQLCREAGWSLSPLAAEAIWVAIVTDTGRFSYENTSVSCMEAALECLKSGVNPATVANELYQSVTWEERQLQRLVLDTMELRQDGKVALACLTQEQFRQAKSGVEGAQNLINLLRDTAGVYIAAFLYEPPEPGDAERPIKVSLRTRAPYSALDIVTKFQGGGHARAAGCSLPGGMEAARKTVVEAIEKMWFGK